MQVEGIYTAEPRFEAKAKALKLKQEMAAAAEEERKRLRGMPGLDLVETPKPLERQIRAEVEARVPEAVRQWENEFALSVGQVTGSYQGQTTMTAKKYSDSLLAESGSALLSAGVMPNGEQLAAMGLTQAQARLLLGR